MTVIAAVIHDGVVFMGADSHISNQDRAETTLEGKLWTSGDMLLGWSGGQREAQVVRHAFSPPPLTEGQDLMAYLCGPFVTALREAHAQSGTLKRVEGQEKAELGLVIGWRGRLFAVSDWFCVTEYTEHTAEGSGGLIANAVLHALADQPPEERLRRALEASARLARDVRPPFVFLQSGDGFGRPRRAPAVSLEGSGAPVARLSDVVSVESGEKDGEPQTCASCCHWLSNVDVPGVPRLGRCLGLSHGSHERLIPRMAGTAEQGVTTSSDFGCNRWQHLRRP